MSYARRLTGEPPDHRQLDAIIADCERDRAVLVAAAKALTDLAARPYNPAALAAVSAGLRQGTAAYDRGIREMQSQRNSAVVGGIAAAMRAAAEPRHSAPARRRRRGGRHAVSEGQLSLIPGGKLRAPAILSGPLAAKIAFGAAAAGVVVAAPGFVTHTSGQVSPPASRGSSPLPVLGPADAIPLASPLQQAPYVPRHAKAAPDANTATLAPQPSPPVITAAPPQGPPQEPPARPSASPYGVINLQTSQVSAGAQQPGQVTFFAEGGPVQWTATSPSPDIVIATDPQGDGAQQASGILGDGQSVTLYLEVVPGSLAGAGDVTISAGGQSEVVHVTWAAVPGL